jgi:hypothetical protein
MIKICHSGKNPTMRYLNRTHKVGVAWLMEVFNRPFSEIRILINMEDALSQRHRCKTCRAFSSFNEILASIRRNVQMPDVPCLLIAGSSIRTLEQWKQGF